MARRFAEGCSWRRRRIGRGWPAAGAGREGCARARGDARTAAGCSRPGRAGCDLRWGGRMSGLPAGAVTFLFSDIEGSTRLVKALRGAVCGGAGRAPAPGPRRRRRPPWPRGRRPGRRVLRRVRRRHAGGAVRGRHPAGAGGPSVAGRRAGPGADRHSHRAGGPGRGGLHRAGGAPGRRGSAPPPAGARCWSPRRRRR